MEIVGINSENIKKISDHKKEAEWIRQYRLDSYKFFNELPMPEFGPKYDLDFNNPEPSATHHLEELTQVFSYYFPQKIW